MQEHLVAHLLVVAHRFALHGLADQRIGVFAVPFVFDEPREMVDARADKRDLVHGRADPLGEHGRRALNAMAQPRDLHAGLALHGAAQHGHRVGVIEQERIGTMPFDVPADIQHDRDGAQCAEDAARTPRVAHVGVHTVLLGNEDIVLPDLHIAAEDGAKHGVRAFEGRFAVHGGLDFRGIIAPFDDRFARPVGEIEPLFVDVHERYGGIPQQRKGQDVTDKSPREPQAAGPDKCDFGHNDPPESFKAMVWKADRQTKRRALRRAFPRTVNGGLCRIASPG